MIEALRSLGPSSALALTLCVAQVAHAQSVVNVTADPSQSFQVSLVDRRGQPASCTLPAPGGCHLALLPGPLRLSVQSGDRSLDKLFNLTPGSSALKLEYQSTTLGWTGVGLLGGGVLLAVLTGFSFANIDSNTGIDGDVALAFAGTGLAVGALALLITGGILTGVGFARAGPQAELTSTGPLPAGLPAPVIGPSVPWEGARNQ